MTKFFMTLARAMAVLGGVVLTAIMLLTCLSVLGRGGNTFLHWESFEALAPGLSARLLETGIGPIGGDFELVEAGMAFCIFAFLPLAQISGAHASVDIFTSYMPERFNRVLSALWEVLFAVALVVIAWRLYEGMASKMRYGETTFILQFPIWWAYGASFAAACVAALVGLFTAAVRGMELATGRTILVTGEAGA